MFQEGGGSRGLIFNNESFRNLNQTIDEQNEVNVKIRQAERKRKGSRFDSVKKQQKKFKYLDIGASSYCIILKPFCEWESFANKQNAEDKYCFLWFNSVDEHKIDSHRERVSQYKKNLKDPNIRNMQFPLEKKARTKSEELKVLKK